MTYCGRPSGSCAPCRTHRRQCDKNRPRCGQCVRRDETCTGYPDPQAVRFRNETTHVIGRSRSKWKKAEESRNQRCSSRGRPEQLNDTIENQPLKASASMHEVLDFLFPSPCSETQNTSDTSIVYGTTSSSECFRPSPRYSLPDSMDDLGVNYFMSTVITPRTVDSSRGYYEYIPDLFLKEQHAEAMLSAISAVGLAAMSNINHVPEWLHHSQAQYAKAVQLINRSLQSPKEVRRDSTLVAVSVLCLYDQIAHNSDSRLDTWAYHAQGAASILALRGVDQITTPLGIRMFSQVMGDMLLACLHERLPMPPHMVALRELLTHSGYVDTNDLAWQMGGIEIECLDLLATATSQSLPLVELMDQALSIDDQFQRLLDSLLSQGHYITIYDPAADHSQVYNQRFDIYHEPERIKIWNGGRAYRSLLHQIVHERLVQAFADRTSEVVSPRFTQQLQSSHEVMLQMRDDVLASMPQVLGQLPPIGLETVPFPMENMVNLINNRVPGGGHFPAWFLFVIAQSPVTQMSDRKWIVSRMDAIWNEKGIFKARDLARKIEELGSGISKFSDL